MFSLEKYLIASDPFTFDPFPWLVGKSYRTYRYSVDDTDNKRTIRIELPGVKKEDLSFKVKGKTLYLECKKEGFELKKAFTLNSCNSVKSVTANLEDGILTIVQTLDIEDNDVKVEWV